MAGGDVRTFDWLHRSLINLRKKQIMYLIVILNILYFYLHVIICSIRNAEQLTAVCSISRSLSLLVLIDLFYETKLMVGDHVTNLGVWDSLQKVNREMLCQIWSFDMIQTCIFYMFTL